MKIIMKPYAELNFIGLNIGECFKYKGDLYMRTTGESCAVKFSTGEISVFREDCRVERTDVELKEV